MTLTMAAHITFPASRGRSEFDLWRVSSVRIESSWKDFTDKAEILLPRNVRNINQFKYADIFQNGDPVIIRLGYGVGELPVEFTGYISDVSEGMPIMLRCENEMYKLKRGSISVSSSAIKLKDLLKKIAPGYEIECDDVQLGAVRYANVAPIKVLEDIKKEAGIYTYFIDKKLYAANGYVEKGDTVSIHLEKNAVSENLNQKNSDENYLVKITSMQSNGRIFKYEYGEAGGGTYEFKMACLTQAEIEVKAKRLHAIHKVKGFDGSITLLGIPRVNHGMKVNLKSEFYENIHGLYYVEKVVKTFDDGGYRQEVSLGNKAQ